MNFSDELYDNDGNVVGMVYYDNYHTSSFTPSPTPTITESEFKPKYDPTTGMLQRRLDLDL